MDEFTKSTAAGQWADFCGYRLPCGYCRALEKPCPMGNSQTHITYKATGQNESYSVPMKKDVPSTPTVTVIEKKV